MDYIYRKNLPNVGKYMPLPWIVWDIYAKFHMPYCHSLHSKSPNDTMHPIGYFTPIHNWIQGPMVLIFPRPGRAAAFKAAAKAAMHGKAFWWGLVFGWLVGWWKGT